MSSFILSKGDLKVILPCFLGRYDEHDLLLIPKGLGMPFASRGEFSSTSESPRYHADLPKGTIVGFQSSRAVSVVSP